MIRPLLFLSAISSTLACYSYQTTTNISCDSQDVDNPCEGEGLDRAYGFNDAINIAILQANDASKVFVAAQRMTYYNLGKSDGSGSPPTANYQLIPPSVPNPDNSDVCLANTAYREGWLTSYAGAKANTPYDSYGYYNDVWAPYVNSALRATYFAGFNSASSTCATIGYDQSQLSCSSEPCDGSPTDGVIGGQNAYNEAYVDGIIQGQQFVASQSNGNTYYNLGRADAASGRVKAFPQYTTLATPNPDRSIVCSNNAAFASGYFDMYTGPADTQYPYYGRYNLARLQTINEAGNALQTAYANGYTAGQSCFAQPNPPTDLSCYDCAGIVRDSQHGINDATNEARSEATIAATIFVNANTAAQVRQGRLDGASGAPSNYQPITSIVPNPDNSVVCSNNTAYVDGWYTAYHGPSGTYTTYGIYQTTYITQVNNLLQNAYNIGYNSGSTCFAFPAMSLSCDNCQGNDDDDANGHDNAVNTAIREGQSSGAAYVLAHAQELYAQGRVDAESGTKNYQAFTTQIAPDPNHRIVCTNNTNFGDGWERGYSESFTMDGTTYPFFGRYNYEWLLAINAALENAYNAGYSAGPIDPDENCYDKTDASPRSCTNCDGTSTDSATGINDGINQIRTEGAFAASAYLTSTVRQNAFDTGRADAIAGIEPSYQNYTTRATPDPPHTTLCDIDNQAYENGYYQGYTSVAITSGLAPTYQEFNNYYLRDINNVLSQRYMDGYNSYVAPTAAARRRERRRQVTVQRVLRRRSKR